MTRRLALTCVMVVLGFALAFVPAGAAAAGEVAGEANTQAPAPTAAGSPPPALTSIPALPFAPVPARPPLIGEWLEYRVCYPVDPLENALAADPVAPAAETVAAAAAAAAQAAAAAAQATATAQSAEAPDPDAAATQPEYVYLPPSSEPAPAWIELPLRLEVVQVADDGCRAVMSFGGLRREVELPNRGGDGSAKEFAFDPPPADTQQTIALDGEEFTCQFTRRDGEGYGFARLWSGDLPFGLARFATADVDIILVGKGTGLPPAFPLRAREPITPSPGMFYIPAAIPQS